MRLLIKDKYFIPYIDSEALSQRVQQLGRQISHDYAGKYPLFIAVLNGAFIFAADLIRTVDIPSEISFVKFTSYHNMHSSGTVDQIIGIEEDLRGRHIIVIEDIIDTGITITEVIAEIKRYQPASVEVVALLLKPDALQKAVQIKYVGFCIEPRFVVGYGLDYDGYGRNLRDLFILDQIPDPQGDLKDWSTE
ncbi:MAG: hypoxanthine phosphoribosyltransferase [Cytophagales bacterium]|nr:hypoxanthine phosphoribosyltransferase [Bernardetiaceae bacterium]MDW8210901.1 hypoxanthine phosphoribosyltransferase [Cytophagales bacterium]